MKPLVIKIHIIITLKNLETKVLMSEKRVNHEEVKLTDWSWLYD